MNVGHNIRCLRKTHKLTQKEVANYLNCSRQTVSSWEIENSLPTIENLLQLSKLFDVNIEAFLRERMSNMNIHKIKKTLFLNAIGMIFGFLIFIISITNVKNYGPSLLLLTMLGIIVMLSFGWRIDEIKRKKDLNTYKEILDYVNKHDDKKT